MLRQILSVSLGCVLAGAFVIYYAETIGIALADIGSGGRGYALPGCLVRGVGAILVAVPALLFTLYFTHSLPLALLLFLIAAVGLGYLATRLCPTNDHF